MKVRQYNTFDEACRRFVRAYMDDEIEKYDDYSSTTA